MSKPWGPRLKELSVALVLIGLACVVLFGFMAYIAAMWSFMLMDNQPADPPYIPLWHVGRFGLAAGAIMFVTGVGLGLTLLARSAWGTLRRRRSRADGT